MLERLLIEMRENGLSSPVQLAEKLGTTPQMVSAMLDTLERLGYLKTLQDGCEGGACGGCPVGGFCTSGVGEKSRLRVLTDKK
jgi:hypothetical protein